MDFAAMKRRDLQALCKRHGLPAGGTNASLVARLADAAVLAGAAGVGLGFRVADAWKNEVVMERKGCLKRSAGSNGSEKTKKVSFALEESRGRRRQAQVFSSSPVVVKTRGRSKATDTRSAAAAAGNPVDEAGGRGRGQMRAEAAAGSANEDSVAAEASTGIPLRRSRRNAIAWGTVQVAEAGEGAPVRRSRRNSMCIVDIKAAEVSEGAPLRRSRRKSVGLGGVQVVEVGETVAGDRIRMRKTQEEEVVISAQVGVPCRVTRRRSSLSGIAHLSPLAAEKKSGKRKAADGKTELDAKEQVAEAQDLVEAALPATVEGKRSGLEAENCGPVVQRSANMEAPIRITRSRLGASTMTTPIVIENKRRRTGDLQPAVELPPVLEVPRNDAPITRTLRSRAVQVNSHVVEKRHAGQKLENKRQPGRRATRQSQQLASSMEEEDPEQVAAPSKCLPLRQSKRNNSKASGADSETNKSSGAPIEASNAKGEDVKQGSVRVPVRRSTHKSIVSVISEKENKAHEEIKSEICTTRSTHKSVAPNTVEKGDMDHSEMVGREPSEVGTWNPKSRDPIIKHVVATSESKLQIDLSVQNSLHRSTDNSLNWNLSGDNKTYSGRNKPTPSEKAGEEVLKLRKHSRSSVEMSSPANDSCNVVDFGGQKFRNQSNTQTPNKIDSIGTNREKTTSKAKPAKRIRTPVPEEVMSVEEAKCEDMAIREASRDTVTHDNESSSRIQEIWQVNATGEEFSSSPSLATLHEECIVQTIHNAISGSESADAQNPEIYPSYGRESSDTSKQTQEYHDFETDDGFLSETRVEELVQSSSFTEVLQHSGIVSEDKTLRDEGEVSFSDKSIQIVNASSDEVGLDTLNTPFRISSTAVLIVDEGHMVESCTVNAETKLSDAEVAPTVLSSCDGITVTVAAPQFDGQTDKESQAVSTNASECAPPIWDSKQKSQRVEHGIQGADMEKCVSKGIKGYPLSPNLHSDCADADSILRALDAAKGNLSGGSCSSFGLDFLFAEEHKGSSSRNDRDTVVEVDYGNKRSACVTPNFCMRSDCGVECENVQTLGCNADKTLFDVGQAVAQEDTIAEKSNNERDAAQFDLKTKSNYEAVGRCILAEKNTRLVAVSRDDEQAVIQVQQGAVHDGTFAKLSLCSTAPERNHLCRLPEEAGLHSIGNKRSSSHAEQSPLGVQSLFSQESLDDSVEHRALVSATSHTVEKTTMSQPISQRDTHLVTAIDDCMHMSQQDHGLEGLPEVSHEGELVISSLSGFSVDANHMKEVINSAELTCKVEGNNISHFNDLDVSCEKSDVNLSVDSACGISGTELGCLLHAPETDNDYICLGSNLAQLESADLLDELIGSPNTKVQHPSQKEHCIEDRQSQVASRPCTNDIMEATTAKCFESGVVLLPAEGSEKLKDSQLNSKLKSTQAVESGCNCDISNTSDNASVAGIVGETNSPGFTLPKGYPADHYLRCELLVDFSVEKSPEESGMSGGKDVPNADTVGNPSLGSAMSEREGASFEEVARRMKNFVGTCPPGPKGLLLELQSMSSKENIKESTMLESAKDVESPCCNKDIRDILDNESAVTVVYKKFLFGDKSDSRMNMMNNYDESCSSDPRELPMDLQSSSKETIEDQDPCDNFAFLNTERDEVESTICHVENLAETVVSSDTDVFLSPSQDFSRDEGKQDCMSVSLHDAEGSLKSNHLKYTSEDAHHTERIWDMIVEKVLCEEANERVSMRSSNCAILHESSHSKRYDEFNSKLSSCDAEVLQQDHVEDCHKVNEDDITPAGLEKDMSEAVPFKGTESKIIMDGEGEEYSFSHNANMGDSFYTGLAFPDEQLDTKLKDSEMEKSNCVINKDTKLAGKSKASNLSNDTLLDPSSEHNLPNVSQWDPSSDHNSPNDLPAPRSPRKSTAFQNDSVSGSVGTCKNSRRRAMDEICTKLQSFKVLSTVKGSFSAMNASRPKQGNILSHSAATALVRNIENMPAVKVDHPVEPNPNCSAAKDTSRRALQPLNGRPREH